MEKETYTEITSQPKIFSFNLKELYHYLDLILLFTKRTFVITYKQTILGPLWLMINPLLTSLTYLIVFSKIANLSTGSIPPYLFYLSGNALWNFFSSSIEKNATTFLTNANLFGKVYFPRLTIPIATNLALSIRFGIQMILVIGLLAYYMVIGTIPFSLYPLVFIPIILIWLGLLGMGIGIIISSLTTKYRDLNVLVTFGMTLWMYATPVIYPLSTVSSSIKKILLLNPVTMPVELFRYALFNQGTLYPGWMIYSILFTLIVVLLGIMIFNYVERTFMDTI